MNALNNVWSDTLILQTIIQDELQNAIKILQRDFFKGVEFLVKITHIYKIEKRDSISISVFGYQNKEKHPICVSTMNRRRRKKTMFLSKTLIPLSMITHYTV